MAARNACRARFWGLLLMLFNGSGAHFATGWTGGSVIPCAKWLGLSAVRGGGDARALSDEACRLMASGVEVDLHRAEDLLRSALKMQPDDAAALCNYGRLLQRQDRELALASDMLAKAVRLKPEPAVFSSYALFLEDGVRDNAKAQEVYERALLLHPSDPVLLHNFAELLRTAASSRAGGGSVLSKTGQAGQSHTLSAQQTWDLGRARTLFERVLRLHPACIESLNGLGCLLLDTKKFDAARSVLEKALQLRPNNPTSCCNLAMLECKEGAYDAACRHYRQAIILDPTHDVALCNLSDLLRRQPGTRAEAYGLLEQAIKESPDNTHAMLCLSLMLAEDGRREEALVLLKRGHEMDPADLTLATHYDGMLAGRVTPEIACLRESQVPRPSGVFFLSGCGPCVCLRPVEPAV